MLIIISTVPETVSKYHKLKLTLLIVVEIITDTVPNIKML